MTAEAAGARTPVAELTYGEASRELDEIVAFFEQGDLDVDQLVGHLERATAIVEELDRRLRRTRAQVETLVPRLEAATDPEREDGVEQMDVVAEAEAEDRTPGLF